MADDLMIHLFSTRTLPLEDGTVLLLLPSYSQSHLLFLHLSLHSSACNH